MSNTQQPKLADQLRAAIRLRGYSYRTEQAYVQWHIRYEAHPDLPALGSRAEISLCCDFVGMVLPLPGTRAVR